MTPFFDIQITIPGNRKPGKYIQKIDNEIKDLSSLVKSLDFCGVEFETKEDYVAALAACNSCQSGEAKDLFHKVYSQLQNIKFVGLVNSDGLPVARCLINTIKGTFAPAYGQFHYMLEQRLLFAGYVFGKIVDVDDVQVILNKTITPVTPPEKFPQSLIKTEQIRYALPEKPEYPPYISASIYRDAVKSMDRAKQYGQSEIDCHVLEAPERWLKIYQKATKEWNYYVSGTKRYYRAFRKTIHTVKPGMPFYKTVERTAPIAEDYTLQKDDVILNQRSTLYVDFESKFIDQTITKKAGWYLKKEI